MWFSYEWGADNNTIIQWILENTLVSLNSCAAVSLLLFHVFFLFLYLKHYINFLNLPVWLLCAKPPNGGSKTNHCRAIQKQYLKFPKSTTWWHYCRVRDRESARGRRAWHHRKTRTLMEGKTNDNKTTFILYIYILCYCYPAWNALFP